MSISSDLDKLLVILKKIRDSIDSSKIKKGEEASRKLIDFLENVDLEAGVSEGSVDSFLEPLEKLKRVPCHGIEGASVENFLSAREVCVGAFDGSSYDPGAHFRVPLLLVNVGFWVCDYTSSKVWNGNDAMVLSEIVNYREARLRMKEFEYRFAEDLFEGRCGGPRILLYDESFNLRYTLSWDFDSRRGMSEMLRKHLDKMVGKNVLPVAVFYTRSSDLFRFYEAYKGDKPSINVSVQDKVVMNFYLNQGERSSLFRVRSSVVDSAGLKLVAFYLKTNGGVMRIEFPEQVIDHVDLIHCVVYSQAVLGGGYPLALQRAHEWAVLTYSDRLAIEEEIADLLGLPYADMLYSGKRASKRWPIS